MKHPIGLMRHDRASRVINAVVEWNEHLAYKALGKHPDHLMGWMLRPDGCEGLV